MTGISEQSGRINELVGRLAAALPATLGGLRTELETHFRQVLSVAAERLDLARRDEFDLQTQALRHARSEVAALTAAVTALEARVAALESRRATAKS